ncbi:hypothetical protein NFX52_29990, partial [Acidovorax facilis]|uniref:hypothetical protein n=1 Tax=Acidovorax facilis TaxID=12917 RepID=UPI00208F05E5
SGGFARMLESVVLICGHCQGLLLHLRITFDPSQWWTLISVALKAFIEKAARKVDDRPSDNKAGVH